MHRSLRHEAVVLVPAPRDWTGWRSRRAALVAPVNRSVTRITASIEFPCQPLAFGRAEFIARRLARCLERVYGSANPHEKFVNTEHIGRCRRRRPTNVG